MKRPRLSALLLIAVLALLAADVGARLFVLPNRRFVWRPLPPFGALTNEKQHAWVERQRAELAGAEPEDIGRFDSELGWSYRPGSVSPDGGTHIQSRGWRGTREYADEPPAGTLRIVVCGDSFTFCQEVEDDAAWPQQLEELWPEAEVPNLGVGGYGTDQALLRFRREAPRGRVDAALVGLLLENVGRNVNRYRPLWYPNADTPAVKPRFLARSDGGLELVPQPFETRAAFVDAVADGTILARVREHEYWSARYVPPGLGWSAIARLLGARRAYAERDLARLWSRTDDEPCRTTLALLSAFVAEATRREHGAARFAGVLVFPTREDLAGLSASGERYWETLRHALDERGIAWIDLSEPLARALSGGRTLDELYVHSHLSREGNAIVARSVRDWLRDEEGVR